VCAFQAALRSAAAQVVKILSNELHNFPRSRAALSLLAFCYYNMQDFGNAVQMYESLCKYFPEVAEAHVLESTEPESVTNNFW
jgi:cytochrome c-type biogenesis protein CcmH/NrfG